MYLSGCRFVCLSVCLPMCLSFPMFFFLSSVSHSFFCTSVHYIIRFQKLIIGSSPISLYPVAWSHCSKEIPNTKWHALHQSPSKSVYSLSGFGLKIPTPPPPPTLLYSIVLFSSSKALPLTLVNFSTFFHPQRVWWILKNLQSSSRL